MTTREPRGLRRIASAWARRAMRNRGVDTATVQGTGPGGRILEADVLGSLRERASRGPAQATKSSLSPMRRATWVSAGFRSSPRSSIRPPTACWGWAAQHPGRRWSRIDSQISRRLLDLYVAILRRIVQYDRVKVVWGSDDMGFRSGTMIRPEDLREFVLPVHKALAKTSHAAGRPYLLHSCGELDAITDDLIEDVKIDGFHSFEDTMFQVTALCRRDNLNE
jgi:hypothetical protein